MIHRQKIEALYRYGARRADNVSLRLRSLLRPSLEHKIFFMHLEKCGGTSVKEALRRRYLNWRVDDHRIFSFLDHEASLAAAKKQGVPMFAYREALLYYFLSQEHVRFVTGHYQISRPLLQAFGDEWMFVIMLRDPVQRWISHYFFNRYKRDPHGSISRSLASYLETPRGAALGQDYVRLLTGSGTYGRQEKPAVPSAGEIAQAKCNLDLFHAVGCLEELPAFSRQFERLTGVPLHIGRTNKNPASSSKRARIITPEIRDRIRRLCAPNVALYRHALARQS